ncbi:MAG: protein kinase, partial [Planctomycetota bacterium]
MQILSFRRAAGDFSPNGANATQSSRVSMVGARRLISIALALLLITLVAGLLVGRVVESSLQALIGKQLESVLRANVDALRLWYSDLENATQQIVADDQLRKAALRVLEKTQTPSTPFAEDVQRITMGGSTKDALGWALADLKGRVVASDRSALIGQRLPIPRDCIQRLELQPATVSRPISAPIPLVDEGPLSRSGGPVILALASLRDGVVPRGYFVQLINPLGRYEQLLSVARTGKSGETYAFDRGGRMLSQSRFEQQLRDVGLLVNDPLVSSILNVSIRDPGVDLVAGGKATLPRSEQPMTRMAARAVRVGISGGDDGATTPDDTPRSASTVAQDSVAKDSVAQDSIQRDLIGYRDYRGVSVVGVWTWLPQYQMGITTEIDAEEAFQPLRLLRGWFYLLIGLFVGLCVLAAVGLRFAKLLQAKFSKTNQTLRRLGQYDLESPIGNGGMGTVYRGQHKLLRRSVAIKVLEGGKIDRRSISRFEREVQLTSQLMHPNTIAIYDYGRTQDDTFFYVMELIEGTTIQELVNDDGAQPPARVIYLLRQVLSSLVEAHGQSLIHRDIKPANILISARSGLYDLVKLVDFGLVKEANQDATQLTNVETLTGTPLYMSPEAIRNASSVDARSDLYSVGAVGYFLLTGRHLFEAETIYDVCEKQLHQMPPRPSERLGIAIPQDLESIIMRSLEKDRNLRPRSA